MCSRSTSTSECYRDLYNWVRLHEALGFVEPLVRYLADRPEEQY